jgi:hypothetical protein
MSSLIADILRFDAAKHGNIITPNEHMEIIGGKDETIR